MHAGMALADRGMFLAHAMAQALGGRYGASHGALNALCLAPALRFNAEVVPDAMGELAKAMGTDDAPSRVEELARLGGFERLRDLGIPDEELHDVAVQVSERPPRARTRGPHPSGRSRRSCARSGDPLTKRHSGRSM